MEYRVLTVLYSDRDMPTKFYAYDSRHKATREALIHTFREEIIENSILEREVFKEKYTYDELEKELPSGKRLVFVFSDRAGNVYAWCVEMTVKYIQPEPTDTKIFSKREINQVDNGLRLKHYLFGVELLVFEEKEENDFLYISCVGRGNFSTIKSSGFKEILNDIISPDYNNYTHLSNEYNALDFLSKNFKEIDFTFEEVNEMPFYRKRVSEIPYTDYCQYTKTGYAILLKIPVMSYYKNSSEGDTQCGEK